MCAMDPCLTPLGSPKSRALSHHKALQKINPIGHSIVRGVTKKFQLNSNYYWDINYHDFLNGSGHMGVQYIWPRHSLRKGNFIKSTDFFEFS